MHTDDEEASLLPRLLPRLDPRERDYVESLELQHREVDQAYAELKAAIDAGEPARYREAVARVAGPYREHIVFEDRVLTAIAGRHLSAADLEAIAAEMRPPHLKHQRALRGASPQIDRHEVTVSAHLKHLRALTFVGIFPAHLLYSTEFTLDAME
jgi:hypothetical protein